eukprot:Gb_02091 [translate_table: standard]
MAGRNVGVAMDFSPCSKHALKWALHNIIREGDHLILINVQGHVEYEHGETQLWEATGSPQFLKFIEGSHIQIQDALSFGFCIICAHDEFPRIDFVTCRNDRETFVAIFFSFCLPVHKIESVLNTEKMFWHRDPVRCLLDWQNNALSLGSVPSTFLLTSSPRLETVVDDFEYISKHADLLSETAAYIQYLEICSIIVVPWRGFPAFYQHTLLSVSIIPLADFADPYTAKKYEVKADQETLDLLEFAAKQKGILVGVKIYWGDAREKICAAVENIPLDCLVMGSRGLGKIKRAILGSVSNYVVRDAPCPVTVVKGPEQHT